MPISRKVIGIPLPIQFLYGKIFIYVVVIVPNAN